MSKPEYIYIDADKMSVHKDNDKTSQSNRR
jgi:hypothetical protein